MALQRSALLYPHPLFSSPKVDVDLRLDVAGGVDQVVDHLLLVADHARVHLLDLTGDGGVLYIIMAVTRVLECKYVVELPDSVT